MKNIENNIIYDKSFSFDLNIIELYKYLCTYEKEYIMSKQLLRSGTSIGANVAEALTAQSRKDFISKMHIAFKESAESKYWINLLIKAGYISESKIILLNNQLNEISKILNSIITTTKENLKQNNA